MSNAIMPPAGETRADSQGVLPEIAPSVLRETAPGFARFLGLLGASLVLFGGAVFIIARIRATAGGTGLATLALIGGIAGMLFHAAFDRELQWRRVYSYFGLLALVVGAFLCFLPLPKAGDAFGWAFLCLSLALLFQVAVLRNETDDFARSLLQNCLLGAGTIMAAVGLVGGSIRGDFLVPYGMLVALLGLVYLAAYVATRGIDNELAYRVGVAIAGAGTLTFLIALGRATYPAVVNAWRRNAAALPEYLVPAGFILMAVGALYLFLAVLLVSDNRFFVLVRRELGSFFYSPIAYFVLIACTVAYGASYAMFMLNVLSNDRESLFEPIVRGFVLQWPVVIATIAIVPLLTMRLFSEEHRSGTFEVLMTTPVSETTVVAAKFFAALLMFLVTWVPLGLLLIALRVLSGEPFDFRPLLSFYIALTLTGAAFVSMGLFFSSLTKSQIGSAVLTGVFMVLLTIVFLARYMIQRFSTRGADNGWVVFFHHISYLDVWIDSLDGKLIPMYLLFDVCLAAFFLFLTVRVLESRRWA